MSLRVGVDDAFRAHVRESRGTESGHKVLRGREIVPFDVQMELRWALRVKPPRLLTLGSPYESEVGSRPVLCSEVHLAVFIFYRLMRVQELGIERGEGAMGIEAMEVDTAK